MDGLFDAVAFHPLALHLAGATNGSGALARTLFTRLLVVTTQLHLALHTLTLQLLLERAKGLVDIIVANDDLHTPCRLLFVKRPASPARIRFIMGRRYSGNKKSAASQRRSDGAPLEGFAAECKSLRGGRGAKPAYCPPRRRASGTSGAAPGCRVASGNGEIPTPKSRHLPLNH